MTGHEVLQSSSGIQSFDDEGGLREMKGAIYGINNCAQNSNFATGSLFAGNHTFIGHSSDLYNGDCLVKRDGDKRLMDSMQAIVIKANGWTFEPDSIDLDDIDAQSDVANKDGWKESMAMFGVLNGRLVRPKMALYQDTVLSKQSYIIPRAAFAEMGLDFGESSVPGGEYSSTTEMFNCPFGRAQESSRRCRMTGAFNSAIDTLVIVYSVVQKSKNEKSAAAFFSEIVLRCKCRCRRVDIGARKVTAVVGGTKNECVERESTGVKTECDVLGMQWCSKEEMGQYLVNGPMLRNGNWPCERTGGFRVEVESEFKPDANFVPPL